MPKTGQIYLRNKIVKIVFQNVFSLTSKIIFITPLANCFSPTLSINLIKFSQMYAKKLKKYFAKEIRKIHIIQMMLSENKS